MDWVIFFEKLCFTNVHNFALAAQECYNTKKDLVHHATKAWKIVLCPVLKTSQLTFHIVRTGD